jgi:hypothetical protein
MIQEDLDLHEVERLFLWELEIDEVTGESLEAKNREEVNKLLSQGWVLLHIYTLKYKEDDIWREKPMGILGKPVHLKKFKEQIQHQVS